MKAVLRALAACGALAATAAYAGEDERGGSAASAPAKPSWEFAVTAYPTVVRGGENYTSAIAIADHGALHLEARYNYESIGARSAFVGWTFSGGETVTWEVTPLLGGAWGTTQAFVPGLEASVAWGPVDFYVEAEYVRDNHESTDSYAYAWSELGFRPVEWLRVGSRRTAHARLRQRPRIPARAVRAGDVGAGHDRRLLVQPGIERTGVRRHDRRDVLIPHSTCVITGNHRHESNFRRPRARPNPVRRHCASTSSRA